MSTLTKRLRIDDAGMIVRVAFRFPGTPRARSFD
jgi:hypothetical protein